QNVRLASKLMSWRIDVKSEQRYANLEDEGYQSLLAIPGIDETLADQLLAKEIKSAEDLSKAVVEDLVIIRAIDDDLALQLIEAAGKAVILDASEQVETDLEIVSDPETSIDEPEAAQLADDGLVADKQAPDEEPS
ncbi:MAG: transcription termination/antitermination protein NusA, partial [Desulfofustis sp.]|nr:transcription termination/antitermination protein NusA [Desulfofustis sp.]